MNPSPQRGLRKGPRPPLVIAAPAPPRTERKTTLADLAAAALLALGAAFERRWARESTGDARRAVITAVPVVIVNYVAFRAQLRFWQAHLDRPDALLVSIALESIAVYWAYQAHQAVMADDSALRLKLAAYGMALVIGVLNYSHYMNPHWRPTVAAVTFGMMSVISPWLWAANSRRSSRDVLKAKGLIEDHAVRLGLTRWFWHAWKCAYVMHAATWPGVNRPSEAIRLWKSRRDRIAERERQYSMKYQEKSSPAPAVVRKRAVEPPPPPPAAGTSPSDPGVREPREEVPSASREARTKGLAAARLHPPKTAAEAALALELAMSGQPFPPARQLAGDPRLNGSLSTRRRAAGRILAGAAADRENLRHDDNDD